ncbi:hypothetical protein BH20ACT22_BH20ACT22_12700 [soil metagenome]
MGVLMLVRRRVIVPHAALLSMDVSVDDLLAESHQMLSCLHMSEVEALTRETLENLRRKGFRMTPQRRAIVSEVMGSKGHINPSSVVRRVQKLIPGVNPSTIYRTLALLDEVGVLSHAHFEDGVEYHRREGGRHAHLTCSRCGAEQSLEADEIEPIQQMIRERHGFAPDLTHFAVAGLCEKCQRRRRDR